MTRFYLNSKSKEACGSSVARDCIRNRKATTGSFVGSNSRKTKQIMPLDPSKSRSKDSRWIYKTCQSLVSLILLSLH